MLRHEYDLIYVQQSIAVSLSCGLLIIRSSSSQSAMTPSLSKSPARIEPSLLLYIFLALRSCLTLPCFSRLGCCRRPLRMVGFADLFIHIMSNGSLTSG